MNAQTSIEIAPPAVYAGIAAVMSHMSKEGISKLRRSGDGGGPRFAFRGIDDVYNALAPVMAANQLMMLPRMLSRTQQERQTQKGGVMFYTTVEAEFDIVSGVDGSRHTVRTFGEAMDSSDKSTNKAMSAAFKYAAMQAFCIPTEGDNDADATTHDVQPREPQKSTMPDAEWAQLVQLVEASGADTIALCRHYSVASMRELNEDQYLHATKLLKAKVAKLAEEKKAAKAREQEAKAPKSGAFGEILDDEIPF